MISTEDPLSCVNIFIFAIRSSEDRFRCDFFGDRYTDASTVAHVSLLVDGRRVLGLFLIDPVRNSLCSHGSIVIFEGDGLSNFSVMSCRTASMLLPESTRSCARTLTSSISFKL